MSEELKNSPVENFDWDAIEKGEVYGDFLIDTEQPFAGAVFI